MRGGRVSTEELPVTHVHEIGRGHRDRNGLRLGVVVFEWDSQKASANLLKHGVAFEEASTIFLDPFTLTFGDPDHSFDEHREISIGYTLKGRLVFVSHCERGSGIRIISARVATETERKQYEQRTEV